MKHQAWQSTGNAVFLLNYHIVWSTKYRKPVLIPPIDERIRELVQQLCKAAGIEIIRSEVMPDHMHLFVCAKPALSPAGIMQVLRGRLAYTLFREFPDLRRQLWGGALWNPSYYVGTAGEVSAQTIIRYIESQKTI
jgi:putative transposase